MEKFISDSQHNDLESTESLEEILSVEDKLKEAVPLHEIKNIFGGESYLIGGFVRDAVLGKSIGGSDLDIMTRASIEDVKNNLQQLGFVENQGEKFSDGKFSIKKEVGVLNVLIQGREVQVGFIGEKNIDELIASGDVNINCCVFNIGEGKIINPDKFREVLSKNLYFCDIESAKSDPMKILSALKQISKIPDLTVSEETMGVIRNSIPMFVDFFKNNPDKRRKLKSLFENINSGEVLKLFEDYDVEEIFNDFEIKKTRMDTSEGYMSSTIDQLDPEIQKGIRDLMISQFGKRLDPGKIFNKRVNSVVYELDSDGKVISSALMDGQRMYAVASTSPENMIKMVSNLIKNNYSVWTTISSSRKYLIEMSKTAGLKLVSNPDLVSKVLVSNYPEYSDRIITEVKENYAVFSKKDSDDGPQVLLMS